MTRTIVGLMLFASLVLTGCNLDRHFGNRSIAKDTLATLPNGDALVGEVTAEEGLFSHRQGESQLLWQRAGQADRVLAVTAAPDSPDYQACRTAQVHQSADGDRAWLTRDGKVLASFDRQAGTATFSPNAQPDWARP